MAYQQRKIAFVGTPDSQPRDQAVLGTAARKASSCCRHASIPASSSGIRASICAVHASARCEWVQASGKGKIYSFSVMKRAEVPYAIAYVTLAEGPTHDDQHRRLRS